jgi:hypothetical protein
MCWDLHSSVWQAWEVGPSTKCLGHGGGALTNELMPFSGNRLSMMGAHPLCAHLHALLPLPLSTIVATIQGPYHVCLAGLGLPSLPNCEPKKISFLYKLLSPDILLQQRRQSHLFKKKQKIDMPMCLWMSNYKVNVTTFIEHLQVPNILLRYWKYDLIFTTWWSKSFIVPILMTELNLAWTLGL